ncbi:PREDICTED: muscle M-line assembly protein unc-89-like isoform X2 [Nelumbo nucifera]|uniref:Muscle M-line assembly protein unc-89-like isoform X2 n=1 Tax=Nelumbo nucifera TaxID=4432 RepID=A0A1U7ZYT5_NELNU|nr:PREDICTED: muscle M-line assembly protein unc-89-like isoform X2 [Nelumbo nucifera]
MTEENIEIPATPEKNPEDGNLKQNSTGKICTPSSSENILPHYLRASTGSCHDFCKYGRKHAFEAKGKHPLWRGITAKPTEDQDVIKSATLVERKKKSVILNPSSDQKTELPNKPKIIKQKVSTSAKRTDISANGISSPTQKLDISDSSPAKKIDGPKKEASSPAKKIDVPEENISSLSKKTDISANGVSSPIQKLDISASSPTKKIDVPEEETSSLGKETGISANGVSSPTQKLDISASSPAKKIDSPKKEASSLAKKIDVPAKETSSLNKKTDLRANEASSSAKKIYVSAKEASSSAKKIYASAKEASSSAKIYISAKEASSPTLSAKPSNAVKPKPVAAKPSSSTLNLTGSSGIRGKGDKKMVKNTRNSNIGQKKASVPPKASLSPKPSFNRVISFTRKIRILKATSSLKNQNQGRKAQPKPSNNGKVKQKILNTIEPKPGNNRLRPAKNGTDTTRLSLSSSSSSVSLSASSSQPLSSQMEKENEETGAMNSTSEHNETENKKQIKTVELVSKRPRRGAIVHPENNPPQKLNFRRGKVINIQSENHAPRRLRFRQGKVLGENQNGKGDAGRRSFRRRKEATDGDPNGTKPESEKVVLRHQDVQGKKDTRGLFNNVIEETASKLVETRKSKVKALVGAFETVISLQESKPSTAGTA